ncbi:MAG TPA: GNAT family N-acetyltransferase [Gemmataceae bacterium]|jgi:ribosomal protein S18 acetylase RimI-like enzyme|nr:GNAT family N-acetyltransferase [Gemmataceae bacterium]
MTIDPLNPLYLRDELRGLMALLDDAVQDGASVGFLAPLDRTMGEDYWRDRCREVAQGRRMILLAREQARMVGSVQLAFAGQQNGAHRAEIERLLVARSARRRGIGTALMRAAEAAAIEQGRTLLILNTRTGDPAHALYLRLGYQEAGTIPKFARNPDGTWNTTSILFKHLH